VVIKVFHNNQILANVADNERFGSVYTCMPADKVEEDMLDCNFDSDQEQVLSS